LNKGRLEGRKFPNDRYREARKTKKEWLPKGRNGPWGGPGRGKDAGGGMLLLLRRKKNGRGPNLGKGSGKLAADGGKKVSLKGCRV